MTNPTPDAADFCPTCLVDHDAMTPGQRDLHGLEGEMVVRPCDPTTACRDALEDAGSSLDHTDEINLEGMRDAARLYVAACGADKIEVDVSLVEDLVDVLDDATVVSDDPDADAVVVASLLGLVGVKTQ